MPRRQAACRAYAERKFIVLDEESAERREDMGAKSCAFSKAPCPDVLQPCLDILIRGMQAVVINSVTAKRVHQHFFSLADAWPAAR